MADYPRYKLNIIFADDALNNISNSQDAPTDDPDTAATIEAEARAAVASGVGDIVRINGSHTQLLHAGRTRMDAFLSHNDEAGDDFPVINIVLRG